MHRIILNNCNPEELYNNIKNKAKNEHLQTWNISKKNNKFLVHTPEQWIERYYIEFKKPKNEKDKLFIYATKNINDCDITANDEGYILGRFVEILLVHFITEFTKVEIEKY